MPRHAEKREGMNDRIDSREPGPEGKIMNEDYLWDGSGEPDPEIQKLENTLGRFVTIDQPPIFANTISPP